MHASIIKLKSLVSFVKKSESFSFTNYNVPLIVDFIEQDHLLTAVIHNLISKYEDIYIAGQQLGDSGNICLKNDDGSENHLKFYQYRVNKIRNFDEYVCFCYAYLNGSGRNKGRPLIDNFLAEKKDRSIDRKLEFFNDCIEPITIYLELQLENSKNALNILQRYKTLCEWYEREAISKQNEVKLTKEHLSKYLFNHGFTYVLSETNVPSGRIDNFAINLGFNDKRELSSLPDIIVAEGKIFSGSSEDIQVVKNQIYDRCNELNLMEGYCVIYNRTDSIIRISNADGVILGTQYLTIDGKKVYFIVINLHNSFYESKSTNSEKQIKIR
jgi:hypothetical protein